ncbi:hypothetical protein BgAZ_207350 [Babesia gibsoni]|uniref:Uncharacterized protein n=1 Tax=Babesia gibsoni TaxID=33632 RepID=A0AAD8PEM2_BABGI|nr:hypothetical protein BgAZ_207350 [Babesia gibsoni]
MMTFKLLFLVSCWSLLLGLPVLHVFGGDSSSGQLKGSSAGSSTRSVSATVGSGGAQNQPAARDERRATVTNPKGATTDASVTTPTEQNGKAKGEATPAPAKDATKTAAAKAEKPKEGAQANKDSFSVSALRMIITMGVVVFVL